MTLTKNNQLKSKDRASRQYPIDFVVPLQLEECIDRLRDFTLIQYEQIRFQLTDVQRLTVYHTMNCWEEMTADLNLTQWDGTSTRIEGVISINTARFAPIASELPLLRLTETENQTLIIALWFGYILVISCSTSAMPLLWVIGIFSSIVWLLLLPYILRPIHRMFALQNYAQKITERLHEIFGTTPDNL